MALRFDRGLIFKGFGALDSSQVARLDAALAVAKANADQAQSLAPNIFKQAWASLIGAGSSAQAMSSDAYATQNLYNTLVARRAALVNDPYASETEVESFERSAGATVNTQLIAADYQLSPEGVYDQVVAPTISSLANPFGIPLWAWGVGAVALYFLARGAAAGYSRRRS
jgi:hypothetical protein